MGDRQAKRLGGDSDEYGGRKQRERDAGCLGGGRVGEGGGKGGGPQAEGVWQGLKMDGGQDPKGSRRPGGGVPEQREGMATAPERGGGGGASAAEAGSVQGLEDHHRRRLSPPWPGRADTGAAEAGSVAGLEGGPGPRRRAWAGAACRRCSRPSASILRR